MSINTTKGLQRAEKAQTRVKDLLDHGDTLDAGVGCLVCLNATNLIKTIAVQ